MRHDLWARLTPAHRELLREFAEGKSMKQAAHALSISNRAAEFRWQSIRERLQCHTPAHAIALLAGSALIFVGDGWKHTAARGHAETFLRQSPSLVRLRLRPSKTALVDRASRRPSW
jgi:DNA-binding CsgD family transcriptional regulator